MRGKTKRDIVVLITKQGRGEYEETRFCMIPTFWNYDEELTVIRTDSYFQIHNFVTKYYTIDC